MANWDNVKWERQKLPKAGKGTLVLAMIFMAVVGGIAGPMVLLAILGKLARHSGGFNEPIEFIQFNSWVMMIGGSSIGGAVAGALLTLNYWPRDDKEVESESGHHISADEKLIFSLEALAEKLLDAGEIELANRLLDATAAPTLLELRSQAEAALRDLRESNAAMTVGIEMELREALRRLTAARNAS